MYDGTAWWARREVKPGKEPPPNFTSEGTDPNTGKTVGWEPVEQSAFARWHSEAVRGAMKPGTYELVGPKVNGNPEGFDHHHLQLHADAERLDAPRTLDELRTYLTSDFPYEGIVWHHPDGRMAKLKRRDFQGGNR